VTCGNGLLVAALIRSTVATVTAAAATTNSAWAIIESTTGTTATGNTNYSRCAECGD
jgi:hypothetical protein